MPIQHAVLALLADGPSYGYDLKARFESDIGPQWGALNIGHVYQVLERTLRDGYVTVSRVSQEARPDRRVYALTEVGRAELDDWLASPADRSGGFRDELFLKLFAAARRGADDVRRVVSTQRRHQLGQLKSLTELRGDYAAQPLVALLIDAARLHTDAELRLLDVAEGYAERLSAAAGEPLPPLELKYEAQSAEPA
jgi:DNA-binding PadR family transcriptional regulator